LAFHAYTIADYGLAFGYLADVLTAARRALARVGLKDFGQPFDIFGVLVGKLMPALGT
jgi:hypothetical protein